jgi:carbamoyltransferase
MSKSEPWVLGLSSSHNGSACLLRGDEIVVAIQEERLSRLKRHATVGRNESLILKYCFDYAGIRPRDLSLVVHSTPDLSLRSPVHDVHQNPYLDVIQNGIQVLNIPHHLAHAVSVFATSGFEEAAILTVDGSGSPTADLPESEKATCVEMIEDGFETISLYTASGTEIIPLEKHLAGPGPVFLPSQKGMGRFKSLGAMFSSASEQIFGDLQEAGKVMGLAPYGRQEFPVEAILGIANGRFRFYDHVPALFQHKDRWPSHEMQYKNLSCSVQLALEHALLYLVSRLRSMSPSKNLCYTGGVALNSVANERIIRQARYDNVYIMPAAEDSGPSIGAAYYGLWQLTKKNAMRRLPHDAMGRSYSSPEINRAINRAPSIEPVDAQDVIEDTAELLAQGKIIGWLQGRSELGPRALGQRSILCDPRGADRKEIINLRVKHREPFRPFAPAVLLEEVSNWFELDDTIAESPFMLRVCRFKEGKGKEVPAVVHVDGTGRLQTLTREANGRFYDLAKRFYEKTGVPIILNTSFNIMGEPIVETPEDALLCLLSTGVDYCVLEDRIVTKKATIEFDSVNSLFDALGNIRAMRGDLDRMQEPERERAINAAMVETHHACIVAIEAFRNEIIGHLGCVTTDMEPENAQRAMRDLLSALDWGRLEKQSVEHLTTAALINSMFIRYPARLKDWSGLVLELIRVAEIEINQKLMRPLIKWAVNQRLLDHRSVVSLFSATATARVASRGIVAQDTWSENDEGSISLRDTHNMVRALAGARPASLRPADQAKAALLAKLGDLFKRGPLETCLDQLRRQLQFILPRRDQALRHPSHSRAEAMGIVVGLVPLLNNLALIPRHLEGVRRAW